MNKAGILFRFDPWLLGTVFALVIGGVVMVYSASAVLALDRYGESVYFLKRQLLSLAIGLIALFGFARMDYSWWRKAAYPLMILSLLCLTAVLMPGCGSEAGGARRWFRMGSFSFQPVEGVKFDENGFIAGDEAVIPVGCAKSPMDVAGSIQDATAAALKAIHIAVRS